MKNASASGSSKSQMLPSSIPLPAPFFKVLSLPLSQKINHFHRFRFHISGIKEHLRKSYNVDINLNCYTNSVLLVKPR